MLQKLLFNRRSVRKYQDKKVERPKIEAIVKAALTAPTGKNLKPVEIIVVEDEQTLKLLAQVRGAASKQIADAPLAFVVIADTRESKTWLSDTAITAIIIQLLAEDNGLKSCWVHVENRKAEDGTSSEAKVRKVLGIAEYYTPHCIIAVGYQGEEKLAYTEEDLDYSKVHKERFGNSFIQNS
ncbi:nitroreductase family protein [Spirochaetota bacterium]